ncbi:MAG: type II toxin-antitoxin system HicA family toxin [Thiohalocapsa sp.]
MPPFGPIKRRDLIRALKQAGYCGPYAGGRHEYLLRGNRKIFVPNPHEGDIGRHLLARILRQAAISRDEWERL